MPSGLATAFDRVVGRLRNRPDTEHVQALIRVVLISLVAAYLNLVKADDPPPYAIWGDRMAIGYTLIAVGFVCWIIINPRVSYFRRYLAMVLEHSLESACLILEGERAAPLFLIYVWVSLGNGFRYGVRPLLWSTAVSTAGFGAVIVFSDFFHSILPVSIGMLLTLIAIPLYSASLIRQLHKAKSNAEQANRAKSRFLATASHELRTPLHSIISLSDLLQSTQLTVDQSEMIRTVRNSGDSLLHLVEDVLDISSIEAGRLVSYQADFPLFRNIAETFAIVRPQALAKGLALSLSIEPDTPNELTGDWKHIGQILLNLLTNAIKFTHQGHVAVRVCPVPGISGGIRCIVSDSGIGMDAKTIPRIFDTFVQSDETATRSYGGVGLGLAIVRQIVTLLGGSIAVESKVGVGSVFTFDIPVVRRIEVPLKAHRTLLYSEDRQLASQLGRICPGIEVMDPRLSVSYSDLPTVVFVDCRNRWNSGEAVLAAIASIPASLVAITESADPVIDPSGPFVTCMALASLENQIEAVLRIGIDTAFRRKLLVPEPVATVTGKTAVSGTIGEIANEITAAGPRVLVVDDSAVNRMVTEKVLHSGGFGVVLAEDADSALEILEEQEFDILLLDINMPGQSGIEVIKTYGFMRMGMTMPPIVVFSAEVTPETRRECAELGVSLFLPKPSEPKVIINSLKDLLPTADPESELQPLQFSIVPDMPRQAEPTQPSAIRGRFPIIDRHTMRNLRELSADDSFLVSLIGEFTADAETVLNAIDRSVYQRNLPEFWDQVHALRSTAANVGASQILAECTAAGARGRASFLTHGTVYATSLRQEYSRFTRATARLQIGKALPPTLAAMPSRERV